MKAPCSQSDARAAASSAPVEVYAPVTAPLRLRSAAGASSSRAPLRPVP